MPRLLLLWLRRVLSRWRVSLVLRVSCSSPWWCFVWRIKKLANRGRVSLVGKSNKVPFSVCRGCKACPCNGWREVVGGIRQYTISFIFAVGTSDGRTGRNLWGFLGLRARTWNSLGCAVRCIGTGGWLEG